MFGSAFNMQLKASCPTVLHSRALPHRWVQRCTCYSSNKFISCQNTSYAAGRFPCPAVLLRPVRTRLSLGAAAYREYAPQQSSNSGGLQYPSPQSPPPPVQRRPALAARPRQRRPPVRRISPPPPGEATLSCEQVVAKQVITRTTGISLGVISHLYTDPDTLTVVSANLRSKGFRLSTPSSGNLLLETFCQVGDVVLVHDESALDFVPQDEALGFVDLIGCPVYTSSGTSLGKVREYTFSPDSGRVDLLKYDALGWPAVPERLIGVWQVGVESVQAMEDTRIYLLPRAEEQIMRLSDGPLEIALLALQKLFQDAGPDTEDGGMEDRDYEEWKSTYGRQFLASYGQYPPATRRELENFYQGLNAAMQAPAAPKSLPPGRQMPVADALRPTSRGRMPEREAIRVRPAASREDPRTRRRVMQPESLQRQQPPPQQSQPSTTASVPIIARQSGPPYRQRDADGQYGERIEELKQAQSSGKLFDEWVEPQPDQRELMFQGTAKSYSQDGGYSPAGPSQLPMQTQQRGPTSSDRQGQYQSSPGASGSYPLGGVQEPPRDNGQYDRVYREQRWADDQDLPRAQQQSQPRVPEEYRQPPVSSYQPQQQPQWREHQAVPSEQAVERRSAAPAAPPQQRNDSAVTRSSSEQVEQSQRLLPRESKAQPDDPGQRRWESPPGVQSGQLLQAKQSSSSTAEMASTLVAPNDRASPEQLERDAMWRDGTGQSDGNSSPAMQNVDNVGREGAAVDYRNL